MHCTRIGREKFCIFIIISDSHVKYAAPAALVGEPPIPAVHYLGLLGTLVGNVSASAEEGKVRIILNLNRHTQLESEPRSSLGPSYEFLLIN